MNERTVNWTSCALCAAAVAASLVLHGQLPEQVPTHWNAAGIVDRTSDRAAAAAMMPAAMLLAWLLFWGLPRIAPAGWRVEPFRAAWQKVQLAMLAFLGLVHVGMLGSALGWFGDGFPSLVIAAVGALLMLVGNYLGKTTRNFFFGIRTPWTLASDEVWRRTHRLGGWLMVAAGALFVAMAFVGVQTTLLVIALVAMVVVPVAYSYFVYRDVEGFRPDAADEDDAR